VAWTVDGVEWGMEAGGVFISTRVENVDRKLAGDSSKTADSHIGFSVDRSGKLPACLALFLPLSTDRICINLKNTARPRRHPWWF